MKINPNGFREYDARWVFEKDIDIEGITNLGKGLGTQIIQSTKIKNPRVIVGHDYRSYSEKIKKALTDGLMFYDEKLVYPKVDFRDLSEGGSIIAPSGNPDYSSQTGTKTFYRIFQNNTNSTQQQFTLQLQGDGTVLSESLSATDIKISVKIPNTVENQTTGFLNIAKDFETDQYDDGDGALSGSLSSTIQNGNTTSNTVTFGVKYLKVNEYFVL